mmetsp:Transcript_5148/g.16523  ORF Transcript_5148/g.16523 Transcript_5148/m.16523 type:complete len:257 (+) Transcript_5148:190-960(+)
MTASICCAPMCCSTASIRGASPGGGVRTTASPTLPSPRRPRSGRPSARPAWCVMPSSASGMVHPCRMQAKVATVHKLWTGEEPGFMSVPIAILTPCLRRSSTGGDTSLRYSWAPGRSTATTPFPPSAAAPSSSSCSRWSALVPSISATSLAQPVLSICSACARTVRPRALPAPRIFLASSSVNAPRSQKMSTKSLRGAQRGSCSSITCLTYSSRRSPSRNSGGIVCAPRKVVSTRTRPSQLRAASSIFSSSAGLRP